MLRQIISKALLRGLQDIWQTDIWQTDIWQMDIWQMDIWQTVHLADGHLADYGIFWLFLISDSFDHFLSISKNVLSVKYTVCQMSICQMSWSRVEMSFDGRNERTTEWVGVEWKAWTEEQVSSIQASSATGQTSSLNFIWIVCLLSQILIPLTA